VPPPAAAEALPASLPARRIHPPPPKPRPLPGALAQPTAIAARSLRTRAHSGPRPAPHANVADREAPGAFSLHPSRLCRSLPRAPRPAWPARGGVIPSQLAWARMRPRSARAPD
jgi:hypothetical protein